MDLYPGSSCAWGLLLGEELWTTKQNSSHRVHQPLQSWSPVLLAAVSMAAALQEKTSNRVSPIGLSWNQISSPVAFVWPELSDECHPATFLQQSPGTATGT